MSDQLPSKKSKAEEKRHTTMLYFQLADALVGDKRFSAIIGKMGLRPDPHSKAIRNADSLILQHATAVGLDVSVGDQTPFNYVKKRVNAFKLDTLSDNADGVRRLSELFAKGRAFKKQKRSHPIRPRTESTGLSVRKAESSPGTTPCKFEFPFGALPFEIQDQVLMDVGINDLVSVSYVSKSLNARANRIIYSQAKEWCTTLEMKRREKRDDMLEHHYQMRAREGFLLPQKNKFQELELGLAANPANAQLLKSHASYNTELLKQVWSTPMLKCRFLHLSPLWFDNASPEQIRTCIESKNESTIETLSVEVAAHTPKVSYQTLFSMLDRFEGLTKLELEAIPTRCTVPPDLRDIHCPNLKCLILRNANTPVRIDNFNCPNLERFEIYRSMEILQRIDDLEETLVLERWWDMLKELMIRGIRFRCNSSRDLCEPILWPELPRIAQTVNLPDPGRLSRWLLQCEHDLQVGEGRKTISYELGGFGVQAVAALEQIKDMNFAENLDIGLCVFKEQTIDVAKSFPTNISSLNVYVSQHVTNPPFVDIIRQLPQLEKFTLHLCSVSGRRSKWSFGCYSSCVSKTCIPSLNFLLDKYAKTVDLSGFRPGCCELWLDRGEEPRWVNSGFSSAPFRAHGKKDPISLHLPEFENELIGWFDLNPKLSSIRMIYKEMKVANPDYSKLL